MITLCVPALRSGDPQIDHAFRIAIGDLAGNLQPHFAGLLDAPAPCLLAGLGYDIPWTRDAAFNSWFGLGLLHPEAARATLLSVLTRDAAGDVCIGSPYGQYWDAIVWAQGAWQHYLHTGDRPFLALALDAVRRTLHRCETDEFDPADGLFRGGACFQDGVAGYPDYYAPRADSPPFDGIHSWVEHAGPRRHPLGGGIPCKALSTNCLYFRAYELCGEMARELSLLPDPAWALRGDALRAAINAAFWDDSLDRYRYLVDAPGVDSRQEGLGHAFALLFGIADATRAARVFASLTLTPHGLPCLWPTYERYAHLGQFGRHSGPVWPQVNAVWALACEACGRPDLALTELRLLAAKACRDGHFAEVYHPFTGLPCGGVQERRDQPGIAPYPVLFRQSWCASGYLAMILACLLKVRLSPSGWSRTPGAAPHATLSGLQFHGRPWDILPGPAPRLPGQPEQGILADVAETRADAKHPGGADNEITRMAAPTVASNCPLAPASATPAPRSGPDPFAPCHHAHDSAID